MSTQQAASIRALQVLRATTYFVALLVASAAGLLAYASSVLAYAAFGLVIAAVPVLLAHQRISRMTAASVILLALAFIVPATLVHETSSSAHCVRGVPCDPVPSTHPGLRMALGGVLIVFSLVTAAVGSFRASRGAVG